MLNLMLSNNGSWVGGEAVAFEKKKRKRRRKKEKRRKRKEKAHILSTELNFTDYFDRKRVVKGPCIFFPPHNRVNDYWSRMLTSILGWTVSERSQFINKHCK
jgi:hypothetical protein